MDMPVSLFSEAIFFFLPLLIIIVIIIIIIIIIMMMIMMMIIIYHYCIIAYNYSGKMIISQKLGGLSIYHVHFTYRLLITKNFLFVFGHVTYIHASYIEISNNTMKGTKVRILGAI